MSIYDEMVAQLAERVGTATPNVEQEVMQLCISFVKSSQHPISIL